MNGWEWMRKRVERLVHDLIGEGETAGADRVLEFLEAAQAQLWSLELDLAEATAREKRLELEWQAALDRLQTLDQCVDKTLTAGEEAAARAYLEQARGLQHQAERLEESVQAWAQVTQKLRTALGVQRAQLAGMRREVRELTEREQAAEVLERLQACQREMRQAAALRTQLHEREEQLARREDRLAARAELVDKTLE